MLPSSDNKQEEIISEEQHDIIITERSQEGLQSVPQENNMSNEIAGKNSTLSELPDDAKALGSLFEDFMKKEMSADEICSSDIFECVKRKIEQERSSLSVSHTAKLWLQFMDMIDILRTFIKAKRTGNWHLDLQSIKAMLLYLAASGHNLYTKCARLYIQEMMKLSEQQPEILRAYEKRHHVLRISDRFWVGLSSDLVIEQTLMRSVKTTLGLTRGRGMTDILITFWLLSMSFTTEVNSSMQCLTQVRYVTYDQHKEFSKSRLERDLKDTKTVLEFLEEGIRSAQIPPYVTF